MSRCKTHIAMSRQLKNTGKLYQVQFRCSKEQKALLKKVTAIYKSCCELNGYYALPSESDTIFRALELLLQIAQDNIQSDRENLEHENLFNSTAPFIDN